MSSGFISEAEVSEQRKRRQEEWEKVRTADQPSEVPEPAYDPRTLYDRLQQEKNKKDAEYEEAHKLKNMIKGLDDDEVKFLDFIDKQKMEEERRKNLEEEKEILDFKSKVASLEEKSLEEKLKYELKQPATNKSSTSSNKNSQLKLLAGIIKKPAKTENESVQGTKRKLSETEDTDKTTNTEKASDKNLENQTSEKKCCQINVSPDNPELQTGALKCVAILPGLGSYDDSSDSDCSSESEESDCKRKKVDILGRVILPPKEKEVSS